MKDTRKITIGLTIFVAFILFSSPAKAIGPADGSRAEKIFQNAKNFYQKGVESYSGARKNFRDILDKYKKNKSSVNKKELENASRDLLEKSVSSLIKKLESLKSLVSGRQKISEEDKNIIMAEIDKDLNWLNQTLSEIKNLDAKEIAKKAKEIKNYWRNHQVRIKKITGLTLSARVNYLIDKENNFSERLSAKINEMKKSGADISKAEELYNQFLEKMNLAKEKYNSAKEKFNGIEAEPQSEIAPELNNAASLFKAGDQLIKEAAKYLKEAHGLAVQVVRELKTASK